MKGGKIQVLVPVTDWQSAMTDPVDKAKELALELAASTGVIASVGVTGE